MPGGDAVFHGDADSAAVEHVASFVTADDFHRCRGRLGRGDPFTVAFGIWGALTCRAGFLVAGEAELPSGIGDYVARLVAPYFEAVVQATEEAVLNSLVANEEMVGFRGHRSPALPPFIDPLVADLTPPVPGLKFPIPPSRRYLACASIQVIGSGTWR